MEWQSWVGSVIVVRQDKKPLLPEHVETLCDFCQSYLQPLFEEALEGSLDKKSVLDQITQDGFQKYWEQYSQREIKEIRGEDWTMLPSPYVA